MPFGPLETDPRFWVLSEALASYASDAHDPPILEGDHLQAAVSIVVRARPALELLLIKRARSDRDPWSGHMALPGGRRDYDDMNLLQTAMRETMEETGLDLERQARPLGRLDDLTPNSSRLPSLTITPFVFGVGSNATAFVASHEVAEVHWVSLDELRAPETHSTVEIPLPGELTEFPCYRVVGEVVWGLTYRMLSQFLEIYPELELDRLEDPPGGS
jgi:8-oxo-dGTP pyrophosphatase MutT (NUDIX family)